MNSDNPWISRLFLISALLASFSCFSRADYNLPLYIFCYLAWGLTRSQKTKISWLLVITLFTDVVWLLYWGPFWNSEKFTDGYWENGVHGVVLFLSAVNAAIKVFLILVIYKQESEVAASFTVSSVKSGLQNFFNPR